MYPEQEEVKELTMKVYISRNQVKREMSDQQAVKIVKACLFLSKVQKVNDVAPAASLGTRQSSTKIRGKQQ